ADFLRKRVDPLQCGISARVPGISRSRIIDNSLVNVGGISPRNIIKVQEFDSPPLSNPAHASPSAGRTYTNRSACHCRRTPYDGLQVSKCGCHLSKNRGRSVSAMLGLGVYNVCPREIWKVACWAGLQRSWGDERQRGILYRRGRQKMRCSNRPPPPRGVKFDGSKADRSAPEILEPMRRQLGVAHGVLNVLVTEPG